MRPDEPAQPPPPHGRQCRREGRVNLPALGNIEPGGLGALRQVTGPPQREDPLLHRLPDRRQPRREVEDVAHQPDGRVDRYAERRSHLERQVLVDQPGAVSADPDGTSSDHVELVGLGPVGLFGEREDGGSLLGLRAALGPHRPAQPFDRRLPGPRRHPNHGSSLPADTDSSGPICLVNARISTIPDEPQEPGASW